MQFFIDYSYLVYIAFDDSPMGQKIDHSTMNYFVKFRSVATLKSSLYRCKTIRIKQLECCCCVSFILPSPDSVRCLLLDDPRACFIAMTTSCLEESVPALEFPVIQCSCVSLNSCPMPTEFAACSKPPTRNSPSNASYPRTKIMQLRSS